MAYNLPLSQDQDGQNNYIYIQNCIQVFRRVLFSSLCLIFSKKTEILLRYWLNPPHTINLQ